MIASRRNPYVYALPTSDPTTLSSRLLHVFVATYIARGADCAEQHRFVHDTISQPFFDLLYFVSIHMFVRSLCVLYFTFSFAFLHVLHGRCIVVYHSVPPRSPM
ncbi:hypothetical protein PENSPDRAFT_210516 [Peniophora sp. CONT]|nr:hypothetical protein PENSPDRAFT_210516 [Peniophora sp. CONT]